MGQDNRRAKNDIPNQIFPLLHTFIHKADEHKKEGDAKSVRELASKKRGGISAVDGVFFKEYQKEA